MHAVMPVIAVLVGLGVAGTPAGAAVINAEYDFTAGGFGSGASVDPVVGTVSVAFDNASDIFNSTSGLTASINLPVGGIGFEYLRRFDLLIVGGLVGRVGRLEATEFDFFISITNVSTVPTFGSLVYTQSDSRFFVASEGVVTRVAAPEPASLALLGAGLASLALVRRRR